MMIMTLWIEAKRAPWSPDFSPQLLPANVIASTQPDVNRGAALFHAKGCEFCHEVEGFGGHRGPNLSDAGDRLTHADIVIRILNGGHNMPAFAGALKPADLDALVAFLQSRKSR
jgi:ubiquinol-cytochrome c reductase cytochrome b subunit